MLCCLVVPALLGRLGAQEQPWPSSFAAADVPSVGRAFSFVSFSAGCVMNHGHGICPYMYCFEQASVCPSLPKHHCLHYGCVWPEVWCPEVWCKCCFMERPDASYCWRWWTCMTAIITPCHSAELSDFLHVLHQACTHMYINCLFGTAIYTGVQSWRAVVYTLHHPCIMQHDNGCTGMCVISSVHVHHQQQHTT